MPFFNHKCPNGHGYDAYSPFTDVWAACPDCGVPGPRDVMADIRSQSVRCDDPIRRAYNGSKIDQNLAAQGRALDPLAPRDRFEARHVEKATGRVYIGDDASSLKPSAQRAIAKGMVS